MLPGLSGGTVNRPRRKEEELRNSGALFEEAMCWLGERLQHYVIRPRVLSAAELEVETDLQTSVFVLIPVFAKATPPHTAGVQTNAPGVALLNP
jgi:hypothetical protein